MNRLCFIAAIIAALVGQFSAEKAFALATDEIGNAPLNELNYTEWKGIMPLVNDKARVYQVWVNGNEYFYFKGNTKTLNAALATFAKVEVKNHVVVLRPGPIERRAIRDKSLIQFNWELHVIGGIARERATDDIEDLEWQKDPVLTIYIGGGIDLDKLEIPEDVTLRAASGQSEEAKKDEATQKKIEEFVKQRKTSTAASDASANVSTNAPAIALDEDEVWSKPVNGLQARLSFARKKVLNGTPIVVTYLELRNVSDVGNVMEIPLDPKKIQFTVTDSDGKVVDPTNGPFDGISVDLGLTRLPHDSFLRFNIASHGAGVRKDQAAHLDLGPQAHWDFKRGDKSSYYLQAKFAVEKNQRRQWFGTIEIPKTKIPTMEERS